MQWHASIYRSEILNLRPSNNDTVRNNKSLVYRLTFSMLKNMCSLETRILFLLYLLFNSDGARKLQTLWYISAPRQLQLVRGNAAGRCITKVA
jgi:hypothetical protein